MRRVLLIVFGLWFSFLPAWADETPTEKEIATAGHILLSAWQNDAAAKIAQSLIDMDAESPEAAYFLGRYYFEAGDYNTALDYLNGAGDYRPDPKVAGNYAPFLKAAYENTKNFKSVQSDHFEVRYQPGKDAVLVDDAIDTLEKSYENVGNDLGYKPPDRIVVEFYPQLEMLAAATGLTMENLRTSGTIAICKFNRMMISSPRVAIMGYAWRDTIDHEYTHLIISRVSGNTVPIWLHEGIAKLHELRWRNPPGGYMSPSSESLLAKAIRKDKLLTLDEMHPSMALLPSQEHAALGYAQVFSMIQWLWKYHGGDENLQKLLSQLREHGDLDKAFKTTYGFGVVGLERNWRATIKRRPLKEYDYDFNDYTILFENDPEFKDEQAIREIKQTQGRNLTTIGKLLKDRQHHEAAVIEFRKAETTLGRSDPLLNNYMADSLITLGKYADAVESLMPVMQFAPNYLPSHIRAGEAFTALKQYEKAAEHLEFAKGINPFDPRIYQLLAQDYEALEQPALAKKAEEDLKLVSQR